MRFCSSNSMRSPKMTLPPALSDALPSDVMVRSSSTSRRSPSIITAPLEIMVFSASASFLKVSGSISAVSFWVFSASKLLMLLLIRSLIRTSGFSIEGGALVSVDGLSANKSCSSASPIGVLFFKSLAGDAMSSAQAICVLKTTRIALKIKEVNFNISIREY